MTPAKREAQYWRYSLARFRRLAARETSLSIFRTALVLGVSPDLGQSQRNDKDEFRQRDAAYMST
jgi:hypothetical protein